MVQFCSKHLFRTVPATIIVLQVLNVSILSVRLPSKSGKIPPESRLSLQHPPMVSEKSSKLWSDSSHARAPMYGNTIPHFEPVNLPEKHNYIGNQRC